VDRKSLSTVLSRFRRWRLLCCPAIAASSAHIPTGKRIGSFGLPGVNGAAHRRLSPFQRVASIDKQQGIAIEPVAAEQRDRYHHVLTTMDRVRGKVTELNAAPWRLRAAESLGKPFCTDGSPSALVSCTQLRFESGSCRARDDGGRLRYVC
jgi:hypothetical protein